MAKSSGVGHKYRTGNGTAKRQRPLVHPAILAIYKTWPSDTQMSSSTSEGVRRKRLAIRQLASRQLTTAAT